jgi:hypothetical protein
MPNIQKALGVLFESDYYIARKPNYLMNDVHFDRFCYDLISLLG